MNAISTLILMLPFLLAILLANVAEKERSVRVLTFIYLVFLNGLIAAVGLLSVAGAGLFGNDEFANSLQGQNPGVDMAQLRAARLDLAGLILLGASLLAMLALLPPVRRVAARILPMHAENVVHATALSMTATVFGLNFFQMVALSPLLFAATTTEGGVRQLQELGSATYLDVLVFPLLTLSIAAVIGVGLYVRRTQEETLTRLGLAPLTLRQLALAVGVTVVLLGLAILTERLWQAIDPQSLQQVGGVSEALLGNLTGLGGAVAIGAAAGIGEEAFFRGAYQQRMGVVLASLLFASFHVQYGVTPATLLVLVIALVLGVLRQRTSLSVVMVVHFLYNFVSVLLS